ncbi:ethanolamine utilization protein EutJ [Bacillaceae bacterium JMAK1]|nr:ethanolamine utilization protein EutJ [Bacillaceae bacterium JMAK1]
MKKFSLIVGLSAIVALSACDAEETIVSEEGAPESEPGTEADAEAGDDEVEPEEVVTAEGTEVVTIGYSGPLSGAAAFYGNNTVSGLTMAVNEINEAGGFEVDGQQYSFNLAALDDKYLPNETGANARRLIQEHDVPIVFIPHSGGIFATQVFNEQDDFIVGAYSSEPDITAQDNALTWRIPNTYDIYVEPYSKYQMERFGPKLAMLPPSTQYGYDWADELAPAWEELGGEVVYDGSIDFAKETDFFTTITNALSDDPDVLFVGGSSEPTAQVMQQARELGFEGGFFIMDQAKLDEIERVLGDNAAEVIEGSVGVPPLVVDQTEGNQQFIEDYIEHYDSIPGSEAGYHYYVVYILAEAMKAAGSVDDAAAIQANLGEGVNTVPADKEIYPITEVTAEGGMNTEFRMAVVEDGEIILVEP